MGNRLAVQDIQDKKARGQKLIMLTAYDYAMASWVDRAGVDIILVGDSVANVVLGLESTRDVDMEVMLHHARAVNRGVERALLVGDMPYGSYQGSPADAVVNARRFVEDAGCGAIKLEWFEHCLAVADAIVCDGIAVMGHVGLTPQTADQLGGFKVQGRDSETARNILNQALALESKGCFSIVLECIPDRLAAMITERLRIPTIGIGAGPMCDGQVLVTHDLLGLFDRYRPKFIKRYVNLGELVVNGIEQFCADVKASRFPAQEHSFSINDEELEKLL